jgi:hypothetical protein
MVSELLTATPRLSVGYELDWLHFIPDFALTQRNALSGM